MNPPPPPGQVHQQRLDNYNIVNQPPPSGQVHQQRPDNDNRFQRPPPQLPNQSSLVRNLSSNGISVQLSKRTVKAINKFNANYKQLLAFGEKEKQQKEALEQQRKLKQKEQLKQEQELKHQLE